MKGIFERRDLGDYYDEKGKLALPPDLDLHEGQVYYVAVDTGMGGWGASEIGSSPIGQARLALYRYLNGTPPDALARAGWDRYLTLHLAECLGEMDRRNQEAMGEPPWLIRMAHRLFHS